ncbi:hypothetical protein [Dactylosporangium sp. CA-092794]|uniref:hypothetical protein n=1 Tax=Dactylosporangium sp. CA-092794 TaxID=3239929 RepID=UPI003D8E7C63
MTGAALGFSPGAREMFGPEPEMPEEMTRLHRVIWRIRGEAVGATFDVAPCPYPAEEIAALRRNGCRLAYLPAELATQEGRHVLGRMFPAMRSFSTLADNVITNDFDPSGWFDYEAAIACPYLGTDERQLLDDVTAAGRGLLNLNQYVVAGQDSKLLTGRLLDEGGTWIRARSRIDGRLVSARFDGDVEATALGVDYLDPVPGSLLVGYDLDAEDHGSTHGGRSTAAYAMGHAALTPSDRARTRLDPHPGVSRFVAELDAEAEWRRLTSLLVGFGFHDELRMSAESYVDSLPRFPARGGGYPGRFDVPLVLETRIPWQRQAALAGIRVVARTMDYEPVDEASRMPAAPYAGWFTNWGARFPDPIAPGDARARLEPAEVGANLVELVTMTFAHPDLTASGRLFDAIGYKLPYIERKPGISFGSEPRTPCVYYWRGAAEIGANLHPKAFAIFRPLVRRREIAVA